MCCRSRWEDLSPWHIGRRQGMLQVLPSGLPTSSALKRFLFIQSFSFDGCLWNGDLKVVLNIGFASKRAEFKATDFSETHWFRDFSASPVSPFLCSCISLWEGDEFVGLSSEAPAHPSLTLLESRGEVCSALRSGDCWCLGPNKDLIYRLGKDLALWGDSFCATALVLV